MDLSPPPQALCTESTKCFTHKRAHPGPQLAWEVGLGWGRPGARFKEALAHKCQSSTCMTLRVSASLNMLPQVPQGHSTVKPHSGGLKTWPWVQKQTTKKRKGSVRYWLTRVIKEDSGLLARDKTGELWKIVHKLKIQVIWAHLIQKQIIWALRISCTLTNIYNLRQSYTQLSFVLKARSNIPFSVCFYPKWLK